MNDNRAPAFGGSSLGPNVTVVVPGDDVQTKVDAAAAGATATEPRVVAYGPGVNAAHEPAANVRVIPINTAQPWVECGLGEQEWLHRVMMAGIEQYPVPAGYALATAVTAANAAATSAVPIAVVLEGGSHAISGALTLNPYVYLIGKPGATITSADAYILAKSHTKVLGITFDIAAATTGGGVVVLSATDDVVQDVEVRGCWFSGAVTAISHTDYTTTVVDIKCIGNVLNGVQPFAFICDSIGRLHIIGNVMNYEETGSTGGCSGLMDMTNGTEIVSASWGHRICNNHAVVRRAYGAGNSLDARSYSYILNIWGHGIVIDGNIIDYTDDYGAADKALDTEGMRVMSFYPSDVAVPEAYGKIAAAQPNVISNNVFNITQVGFAAAERPSIACLDYGSRASGQTPPLYLKNNLWTFETDQAIQPALKRIVGTQTSETPGVIHVQAGGFGGTFVAAEDTLTHLSVTT